MESFPCPGCAEPMAVGVEVCPACRRPRTEDEVDASRAARRAFAEAAASRRRRLAALGILAALGAGAWSQRAVLSEALRGAFAGLAADYERVSNPSGKPLSPEAVTAAMAAARAEPAAHALSPEPVPAAPAAAPDPGPVQPHDSPGQPHPNQARVYGIVYDMMTLRPVHPARLLFKLPDGVVSECGTDPRGRYHIDMFLEQLGGGVSVSVTADGYRDGQLEDSGEPYRVRTLESREGTAAETVPSDLGPLRVGRADSRGLVALDLVLLPLRKGTD